MYMYFASAWKSADEAGVTYFVWHILLNDISFL